MIRFILSAFVMLVASAPTFAQAACGPRAAAHEALTALGEVPVMAGMAGPGAATPVLTYANQRTGAFTIVAISPQEACIVMTGESLEFLVAGEPA